jgi:hypothetical protein
MYRAEICPYLGFCLNFPSHNLLLLKEHKILCIALEMTIWENVLMFGEVFPKILIASQISRMARYRGKLIDFIKLQKGKQN